MSLYFENLDISDPRLSHQLLSSAIFSPYILAVFYAERVAKDNPRLGTQITLLASFAILSVQVLINGDQAVHAMMALPMLMVLAGFFTNIRVSLFTTLATAALVAILTFIELMGLKPLSPESNGYYSFRSGVYIGLILFTAHGLIQIIVRDFFAIQEGLVQQKQRAEYIATRDPLTNLYNRYYTEQASNAFFARAKSGEQGFVLFLDVDNFKMINTRFGHEGGDYALQIIADRLQQIVMSNQAVACRIGGDEFIVLLIGSRDEATAMSGQILDAVSRPFELFDDSLQITCSIGIARADKDSTFRDLYRQADTAMHRAKYVGKNTQIEHHQAYTDEELAHANTLSSLKQALDRKEFILHYQPQIDLQSGQIIGMEALIRWQLNGKELLPDKFIELAEQHGLIHSISEWVIQQACRDCKDLHEQGYDHLFVAVNISAAQLERNNLCKTVQASLSDSGLPASALELELTETTLFKQVNNTSYEQLQQIRQMGVELSIDDFGTGYSNLQYLGQLDIQRLKIDKSFVMQLTDTSDKARDLVSAIIDIAKRFQLKTVAEGIENSEIATILQGMKCDVAQGYYWSRPVPISSILTLLQNSSQKHALPAG
ncbi:MAG: putative bifunctional diguanylate cyclase/phosphodiesterase [Thiolinea sp.]